MGGTVDFYTLTMPDGASLAYRRLADRVAGMPGVVFCVGFRSDMTGIKPRFLEGVSGARGQAFVRFDYFGRVRSEGRFVDGTIGRWLAESIAGTDVRLTLVKDGDHRLSRDRTTQTAASVRDAG